MNKIFKISAQIIMAQEIIFNTVIISILTIIDSFLLIIFFPFFALTKAIGATSNYLEESTSNLVNKLKEIHKKIEENE